MKILVLANFDIGLYRFRKELLGELLKENEVYISLPDGELVKNLEEMGCKFIPTKVDRRGMNPVKDMGLFFSHLKIIDKVKPDKVITYTIKPNIYGGIAARILRRDYYTNITGLGTAFQGTGMVTKLVTVMYKIALKKAKKVFFENVGNREVIVQKGIVKEENTCTLNGAGVNLEIFTEKPYPAEENSTKFLFIGRVMKEKGVDELLYSATRLKNEGYDFSLDIVGDFEDDYEGAIKEAEEKGIIKYHGLQRDVRPFIEKAHCFVLPSYHEGMANTLLESGATGRPLITSNIHGCLEAVVDGETGFLCEKENGEALYEKMREFIELPYEKKKEMGQKSREYIAEKFDKKKVVEKTVSELMR